MNDLYGYAFILLLIILLALFFLVYLYFERRKFHKKIEIEKMRISIINKAVSVALFVKKKQNELKKFPLLKEYLEQVFFLFEKDIYDFSTICIVQKKDDSKNDSKAYNEDFSNEYKNAPQNIKKQVAILGDIIMQIYKLKNPEEYLKFKMRIMIFSFCEKCICKIINSSESQKTSRQDKYHQEKRDLCLQNS